MLSHADLALFGQQGPVVGGATFASELKNVLEVRSSQVHRSDVAEQPKDGPAEEKMGAAGVGGGADGTGGGTEGGTEGGTGGGADGTGGGTEGGTGGTDGEADGAPEGGAEGGDVPAGGGGGGGAVADDDQSPPSEASVLPSFGSAVAVHSFEGDPTQHQLTVREGDVVERLTSEPADGWAWVRSTEGVEGFVPESYLHLG